MSTTPRVFRNNIALSLGIITTHVSLTPAVQSEESFKTVCMGHLDGPHAPTGARQRLYCPTCDNDDRTTFLKARQEGDTYVVIESDEIAEAHGSPEVVKALKTSVSLGLHEASEVRSQTLPGKAGYYLKPMNTKAAREGYALLVHILRTHPEMTLTGQWMPVARANFYEIGLYGDTLVMLERERTERVQVEAVDVSADLNPAHVAMVDMVMSMLATPFDFTAYSDEYMKRLTELIATKEAVPGIADAKAGKPAKEAAPVVDLTTALEQMAAAAASKKPAKRKKSA